MSEMKLTGKFFAGPGLAPGRRYATSVTIARAGFQQYRAEVVRYAVSSKPTTYILDTERAWALRKRLAAVGYVPARTRPKRGRK